jgi:hypothetical protein
VLGCFPYKHGSFQYKGTSNLISKTYCVFLLFGMFVNCASMCPPAAVLACRLVKY